MPDQPKKPIRRYGRTREFADWLAHQPPIVDDRGRATAKLHAIAKAAGVYEAEPTGLASILKSLEADGLVKRTINGRRCLRIEWIGPRPALPPSTEPSTTDSDAPIPGPVPPIPVVPPPPVETVVERPPLVGTVHLALDLDPAMARMVLDLVEGSNGIRPIDRPTVKAMLAEQTNRETSKRAEVMDRLLARLTSLETEVGWMATTIRTLAPTANGTGKQRPSRINARKLGVKDEAQRKLVEDLAADGWSITRSAGGHLAARKDGCDTLTLSVTPSDHRTPANERARARHAGANI